MQAALRKIEKWCVDHGLSVNPTKTEMVLFTRKSTVAGMRPVLFFGEELTRTDQVKHLGVVLDGKLTWREHLQQKYNNCLLYTSPSPRDRQKSRMPSSA